MGFLIQFLAGGVTTFGQDGGCQGYVSNVTIDPKKKIGVTVLINAEGEFERDRNGKVKNIGYLFFQE